MTNWFQKLKGASLPRWGMDVFCVALTILSKVLLWTLVSFHDVFWASLSNFRVDLAGGDDVSRSYWQVVLVGKEALLVCDNSLFLDHNKVSSQILKNNYFLEKKNKENKRKKEKKTM